MAASITTTQTFAGYYKVTLDTVTGAFSIDEFYGDAYIGGDDETDPDLRDGSAGDGVELPGELWASQEVNGTYIGEETYTGWMIDGAPVTDNGTSVYLSTDGLDMVGRTGTATYGTFTYAPTVNLFLGMTDDSWTGGANRDTVDGRDGNDTLDGMQGNDSLNGGAGDDYLFAGGGSDYAAGGDGNDVFYGDSSGIGGWGNDTLDGGAGDDAMFAHNGDDVLIGGDGADAMYGMIGDDTYYVDEFDSIVEFSGEGSDTVHVSALSYTLAFANVENLTGHANDGESSTLSGDAGANTMRGVIDSGVANFYMDGVAGNDTLVGAGGGDGLFGGDGADNVRGGAGNDQIQGNNGNDRLFGEVGDDYVTGGIGNDTMNGGGGADSLEGGKGSDQLTGGYGADIFLLANFGAVDTVTDFKAAQGDKLYILPSAVNLPNYGALATGRFVLGNEALDANDRIIYDSSNGHLYYDADGSGVGAQVHFATLTNLATLSAGDIVISSLIF